MNKLACAKVFIVKYKRLFYHVMQATSGCPLLVLWRYNFVIYKTGLLFDLIYSG